MPLDNSRYYIPSLRRAEQETDECARNGCSNKLANSYVQLPEDRQKPVRPHFCSTACASMERFTRKYKTKTAWS